MTITYLAKEGSPDSPDDPGGLIREVLNMGDEFLGPAEDLIFSWVLRLGTGADPAVHAGRLLQAYEIAEGPLPAGACGRVVELLRETAKHPEETLKTRRRGGQDRGLELRRRKN